MNDKNINNQSESILPERAWATTIAAPAYNIQNIIVAWCGR